MTDEDRKRLEEAYQLTIASVSGMIDRHESGIDMQPTIDRIINHVQGIFFYALAANGMDDTKMYSWVLGPTEHCMDCLEQAGKGEMSGSHWREMAEQGIYPKSPLLFCTGLYCQCELQ